MKDLVESQFIGSKNDIEELKKIVGTDCEGTIASLLERHSSLLNELILLKIDLNTTNEKLNKMRDEVSAEIRYAVDTHESVMPHNQPAPTVSTENIDMNRLIDIVRCEANNIAQQAIAIALNGLKFDVSYSQPNQSGYYTSSYCTNTGYYTQSGNTNSAV